MPSPFKIDIIIMDFDGTITDSIPSAVEAIQAMLKELHLPHRTAEEINKFVGYGEGPLISGAIGSDDPSLMKKAMEVYEKTYIRDGIKKIRLYPRVKEFLETFRSKTKIILSNKKDDFIEKILELLKLKGYFAEVHGGDTAPCLKPDPCAINGIIARYNIPKDRVLFIGDMTVDIKTGKNANVKTCAVTYGFDDRKKLESLSPDILIEDLMQLKDLII